MRYVATFRIAFADAERSAHVSLLPDGKYKILRLGWDLSPVRSLEETEYHDTLESALQAARTWIDGLARHRAAS